MRSRPCLPSENSRRRHTSIGAKPRQLWSELSRLPTPQTARRSASPWRLRCNPPAKARKPLDIHVHIVGTGAGGTGCRLRLRPWQRAMSDFASSLVNQPSFQDESQKPRSCLAGGFGAGGRLPSGVAVAGLGLSSSLKSQTSPATATVPIISGGAMAASAGVSHKGAGKLDGTRLRFFP